VISANDDDRATVRAKSFRHAPLAARNGGLRLRLQSALRTSIVVSNHQSRWAARSAAPSDFRSPAAPTCLPSSSYVPGYIEPARPSSRLRACRSVKRAMRASLSMSVMSSGLQPANQAEQSLDKVTL
jgi:hypothetical protein